MEADYDWQMLNNHPIGVHEASLHFSRLRSTLILMPVLLIISPQYTLDGFNLGNVGFCYRKQ